jgi:dihydrofolate reductase
MISLIAAVAKNNVIGNQGEIPWYLPADLKHFASVTKGHTVIMGRKTYESIIARIGKPLPDRKNIIITSNHSYQAPGCEIYSSIEEILEKIKNTPEEIFIIGGEKVYKDFLPYADKLYITEVHAEISGNAFFPEFDKNKWQEVKHESHSKDEKNQFDYTFTELVQV